MAWFADLSPIDYFPGNASSILRAVGWLERDRSFPVGRVEPEVYECLESLLRNPFQPLVSLGVHDCSLCLFRAEARGAENLFVPAGEFVYVCPELILHYINAHSYLPPRPFCDAVLRCPDTRTMEYKRHLAATHMMQLLQPSDVARP